MNIYLPIAEMSAHVMVFLGMGGGFLMTSLLIFSGVPAAVAVGTEGAQIVASSVSGAIAQWRRNNVDLRMGSVLLGGGVIGSVAGVILVRELRKIGQFDFVVAISYVTFLGAIGTLMMIESLNSIRTVRSGSAPPSRAVEKHSWVGRLPLKVRFHHSKLHISVIPPFVIGTLVGVLAAIMGVGGGFIMVPAMIYLLHVPTNVVVGTSLFQIVFVTATTTILHASQNKNVDVILALILMVGGVIGAQFGALAGQRLKGEQLRFLLAGLVLMVCIRIGWSLVARPDEFYSIAAAIGRRG
jgi:uncharacterized membrane protein YfcA